MNRRRIAFLAPLLAVLAMLLGLTETASAAFNPSAQNPHYGNFLLRESEASGFSAYEIADPIKENGEWIYDSALGVPVYVRQNPWTAFDPDGLFMQIIGNWLGERWQAPQVVRSMANHTGTVVGATQGTLGVASMVPVLGKVADGLSAGISAAEGNYGEAALTAGGGSAGKLLAKAKGLMNVADTGADLSKIIKEGGEQIKKNGDAIAATARETTEKTSKEVATQFKGGVHSETKLPVGDGLDSHHMPAKSVSGIPAEKGPAIQMDPSDHQLTSSHSWQPGSLEYRAEIGQMIQDGNMRGAMATEIRDVRRAAQQGSGDRTKYNGAVREMMERARQDGHIPENPKRN